jgi:hypothetical protein
MARPAAPAAPLPDARFANGFLDGPRGAAYTPP